MIENYIQYASGYNKDNIDLKDIEKAINDIQKIDDEHGAFWVSVITDDENVIETDKYLDLKNYFGKKAELRLKLENLDGIWVCGGNTFILRLAMKISGFDEIFKELLERKHFFYGGYSAGICILCDSLKYIEQVDDPYQFP